MSCCGRLGGCDGLALQGLAGHHGVSHGNLGTLHPQMSGLGLHNALLPLNIGRQAGGLIAAYVRQVMGAQMQTLSIRTFSWR